MIVVTVGLRRKMIFMVAIGWVWNAKYLHVNRNLNKQERPAVADKHARRLRKVCTVYVRAVGL